MSPPLPPADLASRTPLTVSLAPGQVLYRFHPAGLEPIFFDASRQGRLNAPDGTYGVLYTAARLEGAFAETFLRSPGRRLIDLGLMARKGLARLEVLKPAALVDFDGAGLPILGATAEIVHGGLPYDAPQAWSKALHDHPSAPDGIAYSSRHDPSQTCHALFDGVSVREIARDEDLDADWFWELADRYEVGRPPAA